MPNRTIWLMLVCLICGLLLPSNALQAVPTVEKQKFVTNYSTHREGQRLFSDNFDGYADFSLNLSPWTTIDVDGATTFGIDGTSFAHNGEAMSYIVFNPSATVPPVSNMEPHSGSRFAACLSCTTPPNNDWLISPQISLPANAELSFYAKSFTSDYGLERFVVGVSTTTTQPFAFTAISPGSYVQAPVDWTEYNYDLSAYAGQDVYIGIHCISHDAFMFMVDDFAVNTTYVFAAPTDLTAIAADGHVDLTWRAPQRNLTGYHIYKDSFLYMTVDANETRFRDTDVQNWQTYNYFVTATYSDPNGESGGSNAVSVTPSIPGVSAPSNVLVSVLTVHSAEITWTPPSQSAQATLQGYELYRNDVLVASITQPTQASYIDDQVNDTYCVYYLKAVFNLGLSASSNPGIFQVTSEGSVSLEENFERFQNFSTSFPNWTTIDGDLSTTYGIEGVQYPNAGIPQAWMCFVPSATIPAMNNLQPISGVRMAACISATNPPNDDWLITPPILLENCFSFSFNARSLTDQYGLERLQVAINPTDASPANFKALNTGNYLTVPAEWTRYQYDISAYAGQTVRLGFHCVSNDAVMLMIDDVLLDDGSSQGHPAPTNLDASVAENTVRMSWSAPASSGNTLVGYRVYRNGYALNLTPIVPTSYTDSSNLPSGMLVYTVKAVYANPSAESGPSNPSTVSFVDNEDMTAMAISLQASPNPFSQQLTLGLTGQRKTTGELKIFNIKGELVKRLSLPISREESTTITWDGKDQNNHVVAAGIYLVRLQVGNHNSISKVCKLRY